MDYHLTPDTVAGFALAGAGTNSNLVNGLGNGSSDAFHWRLCNELVRRSVCGHARASSLPGQTLFETFLHGQDHYRT
jgi:hypothetical protein